MLHELTDGAVGAAPYALHANGITFDVDVQLLEERRQKIATRSHRRALVQLAGNAEEIEVGERLLGSVLEAVAGLRKLLLQCCFLECRLLDPLSDLRDIDRA
ncbi:hypothetical protein [Microbacterium indicum]|uniref:hypothetical protein n=1 Tax=Microbacterium indicum TaxID=358100 RepID=UPI00049019D9|nr:hypothetical protein [Microbacterium indicum]